MKLSFSTLAFISLLSLAFSQNVLAEETPVTKEVTIGVSDVFVPGGFDSQADAYVVASGIFPNGCYRWKGANVKTVSDYNHEITSTATVSQGMCLMVLIPFTKDIHLGKLNSGTHKLRFLSGDGTYLEKTLKVE